jgi:hypothetical protein
MKTVQIEKKASDKKSVMASFAPWRLNRKLRLGG